MPESTSDYDRPAEHSKRSKTLPHLAWLAIAVLSLVLLLLPLDFGTTANDSASGIVVLVSTLCAIWLFLTIGAVVLILAHASLFKRPSALLGIVVLYGALLWIWAFLSQFDTQVASFFAHFRILAGSWVLILPLVVGVALGVHLWQRDSFIPWAAVTLPIFVWSLVIYARLHDADQLLSAVLSGPNAATTWWFQPMLCLTFWIVILGPLSFLRHTLRLLYHEWSAGGYL